VVKGDISKGTCGLDPITSNSGRQGTSLAHSGFLDFHISNRELSRQNTKLVMFTTLMIDRFWIPIISEYSKSTRRLASLVVSQWYERRNSCPSCPHFTCRQPLNESVQGTAYQTITVPRSRVQLDTFGHAMSLEICFYSCCIYYHVLSTKKESSAVMIAGMWDFLVEQSVGRPIEMSRNRVRNPYFRGNEVIQEKLHGSTRPSIAEIETNIAFPEAKYNRVHEGAPLCDRGTAFQ